MTTQKPALKWLSRWVMRVEASGAVLRIVYFGGILVTTGVSALERFGYAEYAGWFVAAVTIGTLAFSFIYAEFGVFGQKNRDKADVGQNFAGPEQLLDDVLIGTSVFAAVEGRPPDADEVEVIQRAVAEQWCEYRDGVDIDEITNVNGGDGL